MYPPCCDINIPPPPVGLLEPVMGGPKVSPFGFKVNFDHQFPEKWTQHHRPTLYQIYNMIGTIVRYILYYIYTVYFQRKKPIMNFIHPTEPQQRYGVPIGGIGGGSINRGWRGEFCRYQLVPGIYEYETLWANQFILTVHSIQGKVLYQQVLSPHPPPPDGSLSDWTWNFPSNQGSYTGLYPRAWYQYDIPQLKLNLVCAQISPVIPHNYKDSCIPGTVFEWTLVNNSDEEYQASITFTFQNGRGHVQDRQGGARSQQFSDSNIQGVHILDEMNGMKQTFTLSTKQSENVSICSYFNPHGSGSEIWDPLQSHGTLSQKGAQYGDPARVTRPGEGLGVGLNVKERLGAGVTSQIQMSLIWTMGEVKFRSAANTHERYYTRWFPGSNTEAAEQMSAYAIKHYTDWIDAIEHWQSPTLANSELPDWYKSCIFNELYFISDGGTVWFLHDDENSLDPEDPRKEYGRFAYLEGHEYRMYNTYDVHFYASFSLAALWPKLEQSLQSDFRDSVYMALNQKRWLIHSGDMCARKKPLSVPHDLGDPEEEPFSLINGYNVFDVSDWKDLNLKFIVSIYRDYALHKDIRFLTRVYPTCLELIQKCESFDKQGLGIVQNGGFPDQTAYCGGLHIAALACMVEMSSLLNDTQQQQQFSAKLTKASQVYHDLLWTGSYYKFDSSQSRHSDSIMADQLCGYLFLKASGVNTEAIFPSANIARALATIFSTNVRGFEAGSMGAVNGMKPNGDRDRSAIQSEEVWTGVTYLLSAAMLYEGNVDEAWTTAGGLYRTVYERTGLGFETPEGLTGDKTYRSGGYMRALAVYAMQDAYLKGKVKA
ncbi:hypothetical protein M8J76_017007 [Diaphorina citri]|nr:hypothetical protein M8J76_017007 [Diaphorina citri]